MRGLSARSVRRYVKKKKKKKKKNLKLAVDRNLVEAVEEIVLEVRRTMTLITVLVMCTLRECPSPS